jgi:hypothetical protein
MQLQGFQPQQPTVNLAVTASAQTISYATLSNSGSGVQSSMTVLLTNIGSQPIFWLPTVTAIVTASNGVPLPPNSQKAFTIPAGSGLGFIAPDIGSTIYATLGEGF